MQYKISQEAIKDIISIIAGGVYPTATFNQINNLIGFLEKLEQIVEPVANDNKNLKTNK